MRFHWTRTCTRATTTRTGLWKWRQWRGSHGSCRPPPRRPPPQGMIAWVHPPHRVHSCTVGARTSTTRSIWRIWMRWTVLRGSCKPRERMESETAGTHPTTRVGVGRTCISMRRARAKEASMWATSLATAPRMETTCMEVRMSNPSHACTTSPTTRARAAGAGRARRSRCWRTVTSALASSTRSGSWSPRTTTRMGRPELKSPPRDKSRAGSHATG
mmetsp:Transcript_13716/g.34215  ORF Transcript_13716/g.34215 Transcript_13716/m.34215 type:complete len:216 (+) Transcript_13716:965-1612(+)